MIALLFAAALAAPASGERLWHLGHDFDAVAFEHDRAPGGFTARRTLEIRRRGRLVLRFRAVDEGLGVQVADVTRDGTRDVLVLSYQDGTGACGSYRLYAGPQFREVWIRSMCADTGIARLSHGTLIASTAILSSKTRASGGSPHCCWARWRRTTWVWTNGRLRRRASAVAPAPPARYTSRLLPGTFRR